MDALFGPSGFPPDQVQNGTWVDAFTVNGETYSFILISPQFVQPYEVRYPTVQEVHSVLNYMIAQYRIDTSRIYFTGNSAGGGPVWDYVALDTMYTYRNQWTGAINTSWDNASNWTCNQVPDNNTDVVINSGTITVSSNASCRSLVVKKEVNFTINPGVIFNVTR